MSGLDAMRWDRRYEIEGESWLDRTPRRLLLDNARLLPESGIALDAASGVATNGLFLAQRGLHVIAVDISETGLGLAIQRARSVGVRLEAAVLDLSNPWFPSDCFDVILNFHFLERATIPVYYRALKPDGVLFFETFVKSKQAGRNPAHYLEPGELLRAYGAWQIFHWDQTKRFGPNGSRTRLTEQLIARKPA